jgi:hypothetical protein
MHWRRAITDFNLIEKFCVIPSVMTIMITALQTFNGSKALRKPRLFMSLMLTQTLRRSTCLMKNHQMLKDR